jgi:hypothetical protein
MELKFNAYNILWLESNASYKEINKRYKEIEKFLNIGDVPSYELDIDIFDYKEIRTQDSIKDAFEKLSHSKTKIIEFFFWFQIHDKNDENAITFIKNWNYEKALLEWRELYESDTTSKKFLYAKNFLILSLIQSDFLMKRNIDNNSRVNDIYRTNHIWKELMDSLTFWNLFTAYFNETNDDNDSFKITDSHKEEIKNNLSSVYMNLWELAGNLSIFWDFSKVFNMSASSVNHSMMDKIYENIEWAVKSLEELDISSDWIFDDTEKKIVKDSISLIQDALNKTIDLAFYEDSKILLYRDRASRAIRKIVLDLHNNLDETTKSLSLLKIAQQICWTENLKEEINVDIDQIEKNISQEANSIIKISIPWSFWREKELIFKNNLLEYNWKILKFNEIDGVSFYSVKNSVNWVTTWTNYDIKFYAGKSEVRLNFSSGMFNSWDEEKWGIFWKIFGISKSVIEPLIIEKIKHIIFNNNWEYKIWWVTFTRKGYFRKKFFWWEEWVFWDEEQYWIPEYSQWKVLCYKVVKWKVRWFDEIWMGTKNAVLLPEMIPEFFKYYNTNL